ILQLNENLPSYWPIQGSTGYDYLGFVNNLFTNKKNEKKFSRYYAKLAGEKAEVKNELHEKKAFILNRYMGGELENLYRLFIELNISDSVFSVEQTEIKAAIAEFLVQCPVYCYYSNIFPLNKAESVAIQEIISRVRTTRPELGKATDLIEHALLKKPQDGKEEYNRKAAHFYLRLMQFTGPLMAKGMEDTLMYTYNRFIDHNEVGDSPEAFGIYPELFHKKMQARQQTWPLTMNSTSTHDTKRGEGVRARLNVLTDITDEWFDHVEKWQKLNTGLKKNGIPDNNDEYLIYQVITGAYPMPGESGVEFFIRLEKYIEKALREAKTHSDWTEPNKEYEDNTRRFILKITDKKHEFLGDFLRFHEKVSGFGIINSLAQLVLKLTCPGVPDIYQGTELWDLSLVDPDNRRPVDYALREKYLQEILERNNGKLIPHLWEHRYDGRIKLWLLHTLLQERKNNPQIFGNGFYYPLEIKGKYKDHVIAFALRDQMQWYVTAVSLHLAELTTTVSGWMAFDWQDTRIIMPGEAPELWTDVLTGSTAKGEEVPVSAVFKELPFTLLKAEYPENKRSAGVLLHITSLPSAFGVGDLGFEAREFANFLGRSCQKYWQLLPLNPTSEEAGHSPYSSISSMAGNPLLVSPGWLVDMGLLDKTGIQKHIMPAWNKAAYGEARNHKNELFEMAYSRFKGGSFKKLEKEFLQFCEREAYWLDDFALFVVIRRQQGGKHWYQWPAEFNKREAKALNEISAAKTGELERVKWLQFIFSKQWHELKTYCSRLGIRLFGDMPIYMSYDSADVWAHPDIFSLDEERNISGVAGVPPDYFSETGQLWGMPTFRWDVLKQQGYSWWIDRLKKNLELFDLVRIDHFRAFNDY
ncbi:MAG TPA: 4-alpha-glucanotransferase, partial [Bacteroidia bacterium]|nr:4-alpha-glucanotransferase [Bacteroidia bacterium]